MKEKLIKSRVYVLRIHSHFLISTFSVTNRQKYFKYLTTLLRVKNKERMQLKTNKIQVSNWFQDCGVRLGSLMGKLGEKTNMQKSLKIHKNIRMSGIVRKCEKLRGSMKECVKV